MTDKEILEELINQKIWWGRRLEEYYEKEDECKKELSKVDRLIELIRLKLKIGED